ncbi:DUF7344 domain-containing protein [Haloferacaceae archaeon DSL9]
MGDEFGREDVTSDGSVSSDIQNEVTRGVLELDHVYSALGHPRRRYLCYTLLEDTKWSLTDLATKIAAWENDISESAVTERQRDLVYVSLYHAHVPKLSEEGIITFDDATETITTAHNAAQVLTALGGLGASVSVDQEAHARGEINDREN